MTLWQHDRPLHPEECDADPVKPMLDSNFLSNEFDPERCYSCGERIHIVDENDGPESLKAFFRF